MQRVPPDQYRAPNLRQTTGRPREAHGPLRSTEYSLGQIEGPHVRTEDRCRLIECPLRPNQSRHRAWSGQQRTFSGHHMATLSKTQACGSLRPAKRSTRPIQDHLIPTRAPQTGRESFQASKVSSKVHRPFQASTRISQADRGPFWAEGSPFETALRQPEEAFCRPEKSILRPAQ